MASRRRQCYRQLAGKAGATDQLSIENQHVEDLITTPTGQKGHELEGADDKALEGGSTIHNYSRYAGGAAQIPQANDINAKSRPNVTMNFHDLLGYAGGAAQHCPNSIQVLSQFDHEHPQFFRFHRRRCPNSTGKCN